jgi:hypothetical protein
MKIPAHIYMHESSPTVERWQFAADNLSMETGIFVEVKYESSVGCMTRIYFVIGDHQFDSLNEVKRALENKAFL